MRKLEDERGLDHQVVSNAEKQTLIDREIRIQQSVEIHRFSPILVGGCISFAIIFLLLDPRLVLSSGAVFAYFPVAVCCFLSLLSHFRLRNRPRPTEVSLRRIRSIRINCTVLGLSWGGLPCLRCGRPIRSWLCPSHWPCPPSPLVP